MAVARYAYVLLAVLGLVIPYSKYRTGGFFSWNVILSAATLLYFIWREKDVPRRWIAALGTLLGGVAFGLPLFLYLRESRGKEPLHIRFPQWAVVPLAALAFSAWFFADYTGIARRVHIPFDLELYHYPLAEYAFQALKRGRLPLWDDAQYLGIPFAANLQAALFYPPSWLMYAANLGKDRLPYSALEYFMLGHLYAGFLLCYYWLRNGRGLHWLASILGAGVFAFSTYAPQQLSHMGLVCGYIWFPLGWWGIDRFQATRSYRGASIAMLASASALCFLAGYPSIWAVFAIAMLAYALGYSLRAMLFTAAGLALSLVISAISLLPAIEAMRFMQPDPKYGAASGLSDWTAYLTFVIPNLFDFDLAQALGVHPGKDLFYLGAIAVFGLACLRWTKSLRAPVLALALAFFFFANIQSIPGRFIEPIGIVSRVLSSWYFLAAIVALVALLAALGLHRFLEVEAPVSHVRTWAFAAIVAAGAIWSIRLVYDARYGHSALSSGWLSALDAAAALALVTALAFTIRASTGTRRTLATVVLLFAVAAEYKAFGTSRRLGVDSGKARTTHSMRHFPGLSDQALTMLQQARPARVALDATGPTPSLLRFAGLTTPHGFDPFLPQQYADLIRANKGVFYENRLFQLPPDPAVWRLLGVRYLLTAEAGEAFTTLSAKPGEFRHVPPFDAYTHVFELPDFQPPYGWEDPSASGPIQNTHWTPERRNFNVTATTPATFRLSEQFYPGWHATLDGNPIEIQRCHGALQCVAVPAGEHHLTFWYQSEWLVRGAIVSLAGIAVLVLLLRRPAQV